MAVPKTTPIIGKDMAVQALETGYVETTSYLYMTYPFAGSVMGLLRKTVQ